MWLRMFRSIDWVRVLCASALVVTLAIANETCYLIRARQAVHEIGHARGIAFDEEEDPCDTFPAAAEVSR